MGSSRDTDTEPEPDQVIVARVLEGNVEAFRVLVDRYQNQVYRLGLRFLRRREDAQDYMQEVFLKAFEHLRQYRRTGRFYSWLMSIAYNHGKDRSRKSVPPVQPLLFDEAGPPDQATGPEGRAIRELARRELLAAVEELPGPVAVCIDLYFFFGLTYDEVGWLTGIPSNTVKSHVLRTKKRLRSCLSGTIAEAYHEM
ncbi:MAG: sigma-70 family RNA polymerase sigma factor [Spirochaetaceae bacterium]|nr:MAG: sigma-70 family RNA polymerase sigma factor [Spirochaetaceae bacterium]